MGVRLGFLCGSFQIAEPARLLDSTYLNHAHNDWIEIAVTFGVPGLLLLVGAIFFYARRSFVFVAANERQPSISPVRADGERHISNDCGGKPVRLPFANADNDVRIYASQPLVHRG